MQGPHRAAPASSGASHHKQQAWNPSSFIALRGIDMRIAMRTKPLNHMNPRTRGFKVNDIKETAWGGEIHEPTSLMTTPFLPLTGQNHGFATFTNVPTNKGPFISIRNLHETNSHPPLPNSLVNKHGNPPHITQARYGISARKKKHISVKRWGHLHSHLVSCQLVAFLD